MIKRVVISLGGSVMIPDQVDIKLLHDFRNVLRKMYKKYQFIVVCGGGGIARRYISALRKENASEKEMADAGIRATRMNALFLMQFFGKEANDILPKDMIDVENSLKKNKIVICGALRYAPNETSDGTAAKLSHILKADLINISDVSGLYTEDPKKNKKAKLIEYESWEKFEKRASVIKFKAGQHFILDQQAAIIIKKYKIKTYLIGKDMKNLINLLKKERFIGTEIR